MSIKTAALRAKKAAKKPRRQREVPTGLRKCLIQPLCHGFAAPLPGLRLPVSASLSLASYWPLPQQLLPVSATGGGRRCCSYIGEALACRAEMASSGDSRALFSLAGSIFTRLVQIAQLPGLFDHGGDQHLRQDLVAGELGSEPAAALGSKIK